MLIKKSSELSKVEQKIFQSESNSGSSEQFVI